MIAALRHLLEQLERDALSGTIAQDWARSGTCPENLGDCSRVLSRAVQLHPSARQGLKAMARAIENRALKTKR